MTTVKAYDGDQPFEVSVPSVFWDRALEEKKRVGFEMWCYHWRKGNLKELNTLVAEIELRAERPVNMWRGIQRIRSDE